MAAENVLARIADNPRLPTPPALTLRVLEHANRPNCSIAEIGRLVSIDPALVGRMLRLVNSSLYGLQRPVTSIERALNLLGLNHVRSLVLSLSLPSLRFHRTSSDQVTRYWKSSVTIAIVCREMATHLKWSDTDSEMVAGLLCDFGVLLLQETFPEQAAKWAKLPPEEWIDRQCDFEVEQFGVDHAEAGAYFLRRWRLGEDLTEAIRFHHRPKDAPPAFANRATLLYFGSQIARLYQPAKQTEALCDILRLGQERYRLDQEQLLEFLDKLNGKIDEFARLIDIDLGPRESFADLFARSTENLTRLAVEASLDNVRIQEEKTQAQQQLQEATEALRLSEQQLWHAQKMDSIGRLAGGVAHDFNNLMCVVNGNCELLLKRTSIDVETREMIELVHESGKRAANLTRQLLAFSRKQRLVSEVTSLNTIVTNMNKLLTHVLGQDLRLTIRLADNLAPVKVDPGQMEQVILNLAVNARDAMSSGGCLTIETLNLVLGPDFVAEHHDVAPGLYAVLSVRDTGHGMDDATLKRIFEPFFTTKEHGKGTGLGLATVHGIVHQSGGHITVSSTVGAGTVFHIYLPAAQESPTVPSASKSQVVAHPAASETLLLVDDEVAILELVRRTLAAEGYHVLTAPNGVEALAVSDRYAGPIHVLITDQLMPNMTGLELIRHIKERRPRTKIILLSGFAEAHDAGDPTVAFLQKPFTIGSLVALIREVVHAGAPALALAGGGQS